MLTASVLVMGLPFDGSYYSSYTFLEANQEVSVTYQTVVWQGDSEYVDHTLYITSGGKKYFLLAATVDSDKWPKWTSTWASSYGAGATVETHFLGRFSEDYWGDYYILAAEPEPDLLARNRLRNLRKNLKKLRFQTP